MDNPFYHRGAIRQASEFYGRTSETDQILGLLRNSQSVSLIGPRRIGKSSLLLHLCSSTVRQPFDLDDGRALFVVIDCQEIGGSPAEEVYEVLLESLSDAAGRAGIDAVRSAHSGTYRALDRLLNHVTRSGVAVVFLLDEFELLAANSELTPYFFARLRGLTTKYGISYLTASQRPLFAITADEEILSSPFFNIFVSLSLSMFTMEEAYGLMEARTSHSPVSFPAGIVDHLVQLVGPHPFFLHLAGYYVYNTLAKSSDSFDWGLIEKQIEVESESHLGYLWYNLTPEEKHALIVLDGAVDVMRVLEQQCLVLLSDDDQEPHQYTSLILERFVRRQQIGAVVQADPFVIDLSRHKVMVHGQAISLTNSQFDLLLCMARAVGQVVHAGDLERSVWGEARVDDPDRLKTLIKRLRRAIEPYDNWIVSERGIGYALRRPD